MTARCPETASCPNLHLSPASGTCPPASFPLGFLISLNHLISYVSNLGFIFDTLPSLFPLLSQIIHHKILLNLCPKCHANLPTLGHSLCFSHPGQKQPPNRSMPFGFVLSIIGSMLGLIFKSESDHFAQPLKISSGFSLVLECRS